MVQRVQVRTITSDEGNKLLRIGVEAADRS